MIGFKRISALQDMLFVYKLQYGIHSLGKAYNSAESFISAMEIKLRGYYHDFFIVENDKGMLGLAMAYDYRTYDGHCKIEIVFDIDNVKNAYDYYPEVIKSFTERLFDIYPLDRIYTFQDNEKTVSFFLQNGFKEEAVLKEYRFIDGDYSDVRIMTKERVKDDGRGTGDN